MAGRSKKDRGIVDDGLTEITTVRAARALIVELGVGGLTMRRLSDALGVSLGATYHYVPNRRTLIRLVANDIYGDLDLPAESANWVDDVVVAIVRFVELLRSHPGVSGEVMNDPVGLAPLALQTYLRRRLASAGFGNEATATALAAVFFYVAGATTTLEGIGDPAMSAAAFRHFEQGLRLLLRGAELDLGAV